MTVRIWKSEGAIEGIQRTGAEVRALLSKTKVAPTVELFPRSDGPGSSQDLPQFLAMGFRLWKGQPNLHDDKWEWSRNALRTPGACVGTDPIRFRAVLADDANEVQYHAPDFHEDRIIRARQPVPGVPEQFVNNILAEFGLFGVQIVADRMPSAYRGTGLGGSNLAHAAALILASALSGANLSLPQIYAWGTVLENNFGVTHDASNILYGVSLTGGQETLTAFQGGVFDNVHMPMHFGLHGVVSRRLVSPGQHRRLRDHLALVNMGRRRSGGVTSATVNRQWMEAWETPESAELHMQKATLAYNGAEALRTLDFHAYADVIRQYRDLRTDLCPQYIAGQEEIEALCATVGAEYFPVGAGGGTCLVCSPRPEALRALLDKIRGTEDPNAGRVIIPFHVQENGVRFVGFEENGLLCPEGPAEVPSG